MPSKIPITTLRLKEPINTKIRRIADNNHRKLNDEISMLIENYIKEYERSYGEIKVNEEQEN